MATMSPRGKNHWSVRLKIRRPGSAGSLVLVILALIQAVLLFATASTGAINGSLYGCSIPCGPAGVVDVPWLATLFSVVIFVLPGVIGGLAQSWQEAVAYAAAPWWLAVIFSARGLLAPTAGVIAAKNGLPAASQFSGPFWTDGTHVAALCFALLLFAGLGFIGFIVKEAIFDA
jgi:hypothetical protein